MNIIVVGLNYKRTPVEIREKLAFQETELPEAVKKLQNMKSILECVVISTCNRTEIYAVVDQVHVGRHSIKVFLSEWFNIEKDEFIQYLDIRENDHAIEHLYRVTCGLNSMVLGETQILGQIRDGFLLSQNEGTTGTIFNQLFKQVVTIGKKSHSETEIGENAVSVSYAAVELAKKIFGDVSNKHVLVVGAGKMSELTAKHLHANGVGAVTVLNRTMAKAEELAERFLGQARPINEMQQAIVDADILISSTGSKEYVITKEMVEKTVKQRKGRPLFMVDIAVPRDLDPKIDELESVFLYDIDDLEGIVAANLEERKKEAAKIELFIEEDIVEFKNWLNTLGVVPIITALRTKALAVQAETMESIERKMPNLSEREKKVLRKHTKSIVNQLLRDPIMRVKELAGEPDSDKALDFFAKIFALEEELQVEQQKAEVEAKIEKAQNEWETIKNKESRSSLKEVIIRS